MDQAAAVSPAVDGVCEECGFDYDGLTDAEVVDTLRGFGHRYRVPLTRGLPGEDLDGLLRAHPLPGVWSALEYTCHVRDVFRVQRDRLALALREDVPTFVPMGREERVRDDRYNEQVAEMVSAELGSAGDAMAAALEALSPDQWARRGIYSYPEPTERDMAWLARHTVHEGHHHLLDVGRVLRAARGR
jgi:DinB superfamily